jgi:spermidine synthase
MILALLARSGGSALSSLPEQAVPGPGVPESSPAGASAAGAALATLAGALALGVAAAAAAGLLDRVVGHAPGTVTPFVAMAALGFALGAAADAGTARRLGAAAGGRLLALGAFTLALPLLAPLVPRALAWGGGSLDAGPVGIAFARVLVGTVLLAPAGALAGSLLRCAAGALPPGRGGRVFLGGAVTGVALGVLLVVLAPAARRAPDVTAAAAGAVLIALGGIVRIRAGRGTGAPEAPAAAPEAALGAALGGAGSAFAVAAFGFLAGRSLLWTFGNDLPDVPLAGALFLAAFLVGGLLAQVALALGRLREGPGAALLLTAVAALPIAVRFDDLPARFAELVAASTTLRELVRGGAAMALPVVAPVGLAAGLAAALLPVGAPADARVRRGWAARVACGVAVGAVAGVAAARFPLGALGVSGTVLLCAGVTGVVGGLAIAASGPRTARRVALAVLGPAAVGMVASRVPPPEREALLVERGLRSETSLITGVQKNWVVFDRDDADAGYAVLKRGHEKRLLVNGRHEMGTSATIKSHGLLAHLPLAVRPAAKRVCLLGAGNGTAAHAALSHPIERLDVLTPCGTALRAAELSEVGRERPFEDARVHARTGDVRDLLGRSPLHDVILNHRSGTWTAGSARTTTRELLELVRSRLTEDGVYCQWIPGSSLTKEGLQIVMATAASVFPKVELWAGQGGDVLLLASRTREPHDFDGVLASYRDPDALRGFRDSWVGDPVTLLSHFLANDAKVRRISRDAPVHSRGTVHLTTEEVERRLASATVDPVPGLAEIRDDVHDVFRNLPGAGFDAAMARALRARDGQRAALAAELEAGKSRERMREAAEMYEKALELNPNDGSIRRAAAAARTKLGIEFSKANAFTASYAQMLHAVETDSTYTLGFANLGRLLAGNQDYDYALAVAQKALDLAPDDELLLYQMARIWKLRGFFNRAIPYYEDALAVNPANVEVAMGLSDARLAWETRPDVARELAFLERYVELEPGNLELRIRVKRLREVLDEGLGEAPDEEAPVLLRELEEDEEDEGAAAHDHAPHSADDGPPDP